MSSKLHGIDFHTYEKDKSTGYGKAAHFLFTELDKKVNVIDKAGVALNFCMPKDYKFKIYTVGYTPWESTEFPEGWRDKLERVDDIWVPCNWNAELFRSKLDGRDIFVLPHGIDPNYVPLKRHWDQGKFTFLHIGEPAIRKGGDILFNVWYKHFRHRKDVQLVFKAVDHVMTRIIGPDLSIISAPWNIDNIIVKTGIYSPAEMWREMALAHCLIYPSRGEGFGFIPLEAIATGLPTILPDTLDFHKHGLPLTDYRWIKSSDQKIHPGMWMDHSEEELVFLMEGLIANYDEMASEAYYNSHFIHANYRWDQIAQSALDRIESKMG